MHERRELELPRLRRRGKTRASAPSSSREGRRPAEGPPGGRRGSVSRLPGPAAADGAAVGRAALSLASCGGGCGAPGFAQGMPRPSPLPGGLPSGRIRLECTTCSGRCPGEESAARPERPSLPGGEGRSSPPRPPSLCACRAAPPASFQPHPFRAAAPRRPCTGRRAGMRPEGEPRRAEPRAPRGKKEPGLAAGQRLGTPQPAAGGVAGR